MNPATTKEKAPDPLPEGGGQTNAASAYAIIKARILDNTYGPGTTVTVQELVGELDMSRTPIRQALIRLEQERFVEITPRHGFRVLPLKPDEMLNIYQLMAGLECIAIALALARGLTETETARLRETGRAMQKALEEDDLDAWSAADASFHRMLVDLCGNDLLRQAALGHTEQIWRARDLTLLLRRRPVQSTRSHCDTIEAMAAGDTARAVCTHWQQRNRSGTELTEILTRLNIRHL
ncbi:GntR family transcriptional regulator [Pigmentiphaga soli]|uniref:GntR family transcriptional regulator n=1 Tax=Pigmentiphaga soli TaxID=1007095 RepID=A0ABP8GQZ2_9BURK